MSDLLLQNAWRLHQAGNLAEAARLYKEVLRANPRHVPALQMLGFLHFQRGEYANAERVMEKAVKLDPKSVDALYNRGCALQALGRGKDALACFDRALALKPDHAPAMLNRANMLSQMGRFADALASYDLALALSPGSPDVLLNRGNALFELERYQEALTNYEAALRQEQRHPPLWNNRGNALNALDRQDEAIASFNRALALDARYADALANRGNALMELGRDDEALADFERALCLEPDNTLALHNRGRVLGKHKRAAEALADFDRILVLDPSHISAAMERGIILMDLERLEEALAAFDGALKVEPDNVEALSNRASVLVRMKRFEEALRSAERAVALNPQYGAAWHNRGSALGGLKRQKEAIACYDKALTLSPDNAITWNNRGAATLLLKREEESLSYFETASRLAPSDPEPWANRSHALASLKRYPDALAASDAALRLAPNHAGAQRTAIHSRLHTCDWHMRDEDKARATAGLLAGLRVINALDHRGLCDSESESLIAARLEIAEEYPAQKPLWRGERYRHDKIRVAYLSTDFRAHAVAFLIAGIFEQHDKSRFETTAISISPDDKSETRMRIEAAFDKFIDVREMSDADAAKLMREMEIDIAVDLNGFTGDSRTGILAFRPAPVQVNYLGYPGTMGAPYIDYIIADSTVIPAERQAHYNEKVVYLPDAYQANDRKRRIGETPNRAEAGLPERGFVFACFNNTYKIGPEVFDVWMRVLHAVDDSVLWLLEDNTIASANLRREAETRGIPARRLVFAPRRKPHEHLARQRLADLFLDTRPYNAHTTASDALWMGLPLVTCPGNSFPARVAETLLKAIGVPELITTSLAEYEALALKLAREPARLADVKAKLAQNRDTTPMFDTARFARYLESAYTTMWERQQRSEPPASFSVERSA
jgi:predicted O-linked N-acetylglucosamine transferase (SPINDLY family)